MPRRPWYQARRSRPWELQPSPDPFLRPVERVFRLRSFGGLQGDVDAIVRVISHYEPVVLQKRRRRVPTPAVVDEHLLARCRPSVGIHLEVLTVDPVAIGEPPLLLRLCGVGCRRAIDEIGERYQMGRAVHVEVAGAYQGNGLGKRAGGCGCSGADAAKRPIDNASLLKRISRAIAFPQ